LLFSSRPLAPELKGIPVDLLLSFLRVAMGVLVSGRRVGPLANWIARHVRWRSAALAIIQIVASIPATAFFPVVVSC